MSIISSRRAYEFAQDDIRLTLLSSQPVVAFIRQTFQFEGAAVASPMETFGPVPATIPPGLVFNYGIAPEPKESGTAIRLLHIEQRRVVIDLAGPSTAIEPTFAHLRTILEELRTQEGYPAIAEPISIQDHSEIRATLDLDSSQLAPPALLESATNLLACKESSQTIIPVITLRMLDNSESEYPGGGVPLTHTYTLDIRAGTSIEERVYYSSAPVDSQRHIAFLEEIESAFSH
jgi:hypothetical protein